MNSLPDFSTLRTMVVGDVMLDRYWYGKVERISPESPVPVVDVADWDVRLGGAANVAANVIALQSTCSLISIVGGDDAGRQLLSLIEQQGIQSRLLVDDASRTTEKLRIVARNQQLLRVDFESKPKHEILAKTLEDFRQCLDESDVLILSDYGKGGLAHIEEMICRARERGIPVVVDPKGTDYQRYRGATMITPNMKEFEQAGGDISGESRIEKSAWEMIERLELDAILVTRSEKGMTMFNKRKERFHSPALAREVFDVSGAGDTVVAVAGVGIAINMEENALLELANHAAGQVVGKFGTAIVDINQIGLDKLAGLEQ